MSDVIGAVGVVVAIVIAVAVLAAFLASSGTPYRVSTLEDGTQVWRGPGDLGRPREFVVAQRDGMVEIREVEGTTPVAVQSDVVTHGRKLSSVKRQFRPAESSTAVEIKSIYGSVPRRLLNGVIAGASLVAVFAMLGLLIALAVLAVWAVTTGVSLVF